MEGRQFNGQGPASTKAAQRRFDEACRLTKAVLRVTCRAALAQPPTGRVPEPAPDRRDRSPLQQTRFKQKSESDTLKRAHQKRGWRGSECAFFRPERWHLEPTKRNIQLNLQCGRVRNTNRPAKPRRGPPKITQRFGGRGAQRGKRSLTRNGSTAKGNHSKGNHFEMRGRGGGSEPGSHLRHKSYKRNKQGLLRLSLHSQQVQSGRSEGDALPDAYVEGPKMRSTVSVRGPRESGHTANS